MRCTVVVKGREVTFESPYTDAEAIDVLRGHIARRRILSTVAEKLLRQAEEGKKLSRRQLDWVHKFVHDSEERGRNRTPREISGHARVAGSHRSVYGDYPPTPSDEDS